MKVLSKNENLSSLELTIAVTDPKVKNMVNEQLRPDISVTIYCSSINTNQENILKLILDLLTVTKIYNKNGKLKQKGFYKFPSS